MTDKILATDTWETALGGKAVTQYIIREGRVCVMGEGTTLSEIIENDNCHDALERIRKKLKRTWVLLKSEEMVD